MTTIGFQQKPLRRLDEPEYSFDRGGNKYARRIDDGLKRYGPYDSQAQGRDPFRILVVAPEENTGEVQVAVQKLLNGIRSSNVFGGIKAMFRLQNLEMTYTFAAGGPVAPMKRYANAVNRAMLERIASQREQRLRSRLG